jgi:arylformamidase
VFRPERPRGTVVFIHGGYFRSFSKAEFSFVADGFVGTDLSVALINYPLCPEVSLETLIDSVQRSFARLLHDVLTPAERGRIVVTGHSAGGYLTGALVATDWTAHGLPAAPFHGAVPISGVFDLGPLVQTSMNEQIRLDAVRAHALDLTRAAPRVAVPVVAAVGAVESAEFRRQSAALAAAWPGTSVLEVAGANHFTVLDALAAPGGVLQASVMGLIDRAPA